MVAEDVHILEMVGGSVLELDAQEVTEVGGRTATKFNYDSGGVVGW